MRSCLYGICKAKGVDLEMTEVDLARGDSHDFFDDENWEKLPSEFGKAIGMPSSRPPLAPLGPAQFVEQTGSNPNSLPRISTWFSLADRLTKKRPQPWSCGVSRCFKLHRSTQCVFGNTQKTWAGHAMECQPVCGN